MAKNPDYQHNKSINKGLVAGAGGGTIAFIVSIIAPYLSDKLKMSPAQVTSGLTSIFILVAGVIAYFKNRVKNAKQV